jgi:hypothetical protein
MCIIVQPTFEPIHPSFHTKLSATSVPVVEKFLVTARRNPGSECRHRRIALSLATRSMNFFSARQKHLIANLLNKT